MLYKIDGSGLGRSVSSCARACSVTLLTLSQASTGPPELLLRFVRRFWSAPER